MAQVLSPKEGEHPTKDDLLANEDELRAAFGESSELKIYQEYAAMRGDVNAQLNMAVDYYWGNHVPRDLARVCTTLFLFIFCSLIYSFM